MNELTGLLANEYMGRFSCRHIGSSDFSDRLLLTCGSPRLTHFCEACLVFRESGFLRNVSGPHRQVASFMRLFKSFGPGIQIMDHKFSIYTPSSSLSISSYMAFSFARVSASAFQIPLPDASIMRLKRFPKAYNKCLCQYSQASFCSSWYMSRDPGWPS